MTERGILELLTRRGFGVTLIFHADESVTVRAIGPDGRMFRGKGDTELQAAVRVWNRLGFSPALRAGREDRFAEVLRGRSAGWMMRTWNAVMRSRRPAGNTAASRVME